MPSSSTGKWGSVHKYKCIRCSTSVPGNGNYNRSRSSLYSVSLYSQKLKVPVGNTPLIRQDLLCMYVRVLLNIEPPINLRANTAGHHDIKQRVLRAELWQDRSVQTGIIFQSQA